MCEVTRLWIEKHLKAESYRDPERTETYTLWMVRVPFYLLSESVEIDEKKVAQDKLRIYDKTGVRSYSTPSERRAQLFKYGMSELGGPSRHIFDRFERAIHRTLTAGEIVEDIDGFCSTEEDCLGHLVGKRTYVLDGFCELWPDNISSNHVVIQSADSLHE